MSGGVDLQTMNRYLQTRPPEDRGSRGMSGRPSGRTSYNEEQAFTPGMIPRGEVDPFAARAAAEQRRLGEAQAEREREAETEPCPASVSLACGLHS